MEGKQKKKKKHNQIDPFVGRPLSPDKKLQIIMLELHDFIIYMQCNMQSFLYMLHLNYIAKNSKLLEVR